ncbi:hypothetical protein HN385_06015 [archaeon]|jgi:hypothetical protein|nr:hypothetical protein [archaeon]
MTDLQKDYYQNVEEIGFLKHVLYSDTDSIYIVIPADIKDLAAKEKLELAKRVSVDINNEIQSYVIDNLFKRANISPEHNMIDFKTEVILDSIMFIPKVKKQYAYKMIADGPEIFDTPITDYKGIQVVRSDASELGKKLLKNSIENIILSSDIKKKDKLKYILDIVNATHQEYIKLCGEFIFEDVTISSKWGKDQTTINSMKLYNFITNSNVFLPASAGRFIYCKFGNIPKLRNSGIDMNKINAISIPYSYDPELIKTKFQEYAITIDVEKQWGRVYTTTVQRIVDLVKEEAK